VQHHSKLIGGEQGIRTRDAERLHYERAGLNVPLESPETLRFASGFASGIAARLLFVSMTKIELLCSTAMYSRRVRGIHLRALLVAYVADP
jgi:hypothetical protein